MTDTRRIDSIIVGERHRRDLGDIDTLAASIAEIGLLQPIVVRPDGMLIVNITASTAATVIVTGIMTGAAS